MKVQQRREVEALRVDYTTSTGLAKAV